MERIINILTENAVDVALNILFAVLIIIIGLKIVKVIEKLLKKSKALAKIDPSVQTFVISFISIALKIIVFLTAASVLGIPMTSMVTIIGSCGLALGLSLQGGLTNLAGGLMILLFKPFKVGDYIDTHTDSGTVKAITMFYTTLVTPDNRQVMLPNGELSNKPITNYSALDKRRVDLTYSVSYDTDIKKVQKVITDVISKHELILKDEEIFVRLSEAADSALIFTVRAWTKTDDYWTVNFDLKEQIKEAFDKNNIEIPFNQMDVHILNK